MITQLFPLFGGLATIVAALVTVVGGGMMYRHQKNMDWRLRLVEEKRATYVSVIKFISELSSEIQLSSDKSSLPRDEALRAFHSLPLLALYAPSDLVEKAVSVIDGITGNVTGVMPDKKITLRSLAVDMRSDLLASLHETK